MLVCLSLRDLVILWRLARGHERDSKERPGVFLELPRQLVIDLLGSHLPPEGLLCPPPTPERLLPQDQPTERALVLVLSVGEESVQQPVPS